ncbi:MAG: hypothetical protein WCA10_07420 [Terracidiphilus sp.]
MAYKALATGPVSFLDGNSNQQEIPLSAISFGLNGPDASSWSNYAANSGLIQQLLQRLVTQGLLTPDTAASPSAALSITANTAGTTGNEIEVSISNVSASAGTMTVAVSATEVYPGLTTATLGNALGATAAAANGLVYLQSNNPQAPAKYSQNTSVGPDFTYAVPEAADATQTAFTLAAADSADAADAANISVSVVPDPDPAATFTITTSWTKSQDNVTLAMLTGAGNPFAFLVTFTAPAGGALPAPGTVTLQGGATASSSAAASASATLISS